VSLNRKQFLGLLGSVPILGVLTGAYMRWLEPHWFETTRKDLKLHNLKQSIRLLHLSDFHITSASDLKALKSAIGRGLMEKPDLAVITGDFFTTGFDDLASYAHSLRLLSNRIPTFACPGNHDGGDWAARAHGYADLSRLRTLLADANIALLENSSAQVTIRGQAIRLVGLGDLWARTFDPGEVLTKRRNDSDIPTIVLSHNPDTKEQLKSYHWDLLCCGHTHGGQCVIPILGWRPFLPVRDKSFPEGVLTWENRHIHITRGVGNLHGLRLNCRPEVSLLNLS